MKHRPNDLTHVLRRPVEITLRSNGMDSSSPKRHLGAKLVSDITSKRKGGVTMKLSRVGIDLAKNVYQLHGVDRSGKTVWKRRLKRHQWFKVLLDTVGPACEIGMEACAGAHHWGRQLRRFVKQ